MKPIFPPQTKNLEAVAQALDLAEYQTWVRAGKKDGYKPLPPGMYVQVATVARIVCECGAKFIWCHHAQDHYDEAHRPKPGRLTVISRRIRWAWKLKSLTPLKDPWARE